MQEAGAISLTRIVSQQLVRVASNDISYDWARILSSGIIACQNDSVSLHASLVSASMCMPGGENARWAGPNKEVKSICRKLAYIFPFLYRQSLSI